MAVKFYVTVPVNVSGTESEEYSGFDPINLAQLAAMCDGLMTTDAGEVLIDPSDEPNFEILGIPVWASATMQQCYKESAVTM